MAKESLKNLAPVLTTLALSANLTGCGTVGGMLGDVMLDGQPIDEVVANQTGLGSIYKLIKYANNRVELIQGLNASLTQVQNIKNPQTRAQVSEMLQNALITCTTTTNFAECKATADQVTSFIDGGQTYMSNYQEQIRHQREAARTAKIDRLGGQIHSAFMICLEPEVKNDPKDFGFINDGQWYRSVPTLKLETDCYGEAAALKLTAQQRRELNKLSPEQRQTKLQRIARDKAANNPDHFQMAVIDCRTGAPSASYTLDPTTGSISCN